VIAQHCQHRQNLAFPKCRRAVSCLDIGQLTLLPRKHVEHMQPTLLSLIQICWDCYSCMAFYTNKSVLTFILLQLRCQVFLHQTAIFTQILDYSTRNQHTVYPKPLIIMASHSPRALSIVELLERVLVYLPVTDVLANAQRVSKAWRNCIHNSIVLKQKCFITAQGTYKDHHFFSDPIPLSSDAQTTDNNNPISRVFNPDVLHPLLRLLFSPGPEFFWSETSQGLRLHFILGEDYDMRPTLRRLTTLLQDTYANASCKEAMATRPLSETFSIEVRSHDREYMYYKGLKARSKGITVQMVLHLFVQVCEKTLHRHNLITAQVFTMMSIQDLQQLL
jgi:hypothetical protein